MILKEVVAVLLILFIIVIFGNIWFSFIESILNKIKSLFKTNTGTWHEFTEENKNRKN